MTFEVYLWNGFILYNEPRLKKDGDKVTIHIKSLEDFVILSKQYDLMFSGDILHLDDKGKKFRTR